MIVVINFILFIQLNTHTFLSFPFSSVATRRQFIAEMTLSAWNAYKQHAWGNATLRPLSHVPPKRNAFGDLGPGSGETIIGALSTLLVMNLREQAIDGLVWVADDSKLNFFLLNTNSLLFDKHIAGQWGGLLSAYTLLLLEDNRATLAEAVRQSAEELANILKGAYKESGKPLLEGLASTVFTSYFFF